MIKNAFVFTVIVLSLISNPISLQNFNMGIFDNTDGINPFGGLANQAWAESDEDNEENDDENDSSEIEDEEHDENQDEENEEETEIQVDIEDGVAKVEVKHGGEKSEFELETIDEDAIIEEIVTRTGLTREQVESVIEFEIEFEEEELEEIEVELLEDETEPSIKVKAETLGDQSEVRAELEFVTTSTDPDLIIDEIIEAFALTREQADSLLEMESEDDDELEEKFEVEIEIENEFSEVKVELRFVVNSTNRDAILDAIEEKTTLTVEQINNSLELENEETDDEFEETEIKVEIKNEVAKIKIEQNGAKSKFLLDTTDEAEILDAISQKTGLTESQIQDIWELEVESEDVDDSDESDHAKTITQKEESVQEAQSRIAELESQISELEQRIQALLEKLQSGEYFGNIENADDVSKSFSISFDGSAVSVQDKSETILSGEIFLETQLTNQNISKLRVTGGEMIIGDAYYDVMFGKARISSSGPSGVKDSMVLIGEVMDQEGNVSTIRLSIDSPVPLDVDFGQEPVDVQISAPSKIAKQWSLEATGQMEPL